LLDIDPMNEIQVELIDNKESCSESEVVVVQNDIYNFWEFSPGASEQSFRMSKKKLKVLLVVTQTFLLILGAIYISWWPNNINIFPHGTSKHIRSGKKLVQNWQIIFLTLTLTSTYYGCWAKDRGWLMVSMFMNIGIINLFPFYKFSKQSSLTLPTTMLAICSVFICYAFSERIQDKQFSLVHQEVNKLQEEEEIRLTFLQKFENYDRDSDLNSEEQDDRKRLTMLLRSNTQQIAIVAEESLRIKKHWQCFDIPDMNVYMLGNLQVGISMAMIFVGIIWMMLHEAMVTKPSIGDCWGWPGGECHWYYGLEEQKTYVIIIAFHMGIAGFIGFLGGVGHYRTLLILALAITILPFVAITQNGIYVIGIAARVRMMCDDCRMMCDDCDDCSFIKELWGNCFTCKTQIKYHNINIIFMVICCSLSLAHLWVCLRFSEKLQFVSEAERTTVESSIGATYNLLCFNANPMRLYLESLLILAFGIIACGIAEINYGWQAMTSTQTAKHATFSGLVLDSPEFIDAKFIFGFFAIITAGCVFWFVYEQSRFFYCFTFCVLVETMGRAWDNGVWHWLKLQYGISVIASSTNMISLNSMYIMSLNASYYKNLSYPVYIEDEAQTLVSSSMIAYYACGVMCILAIFIGMLACEAIQDLERILNDNSMTKMRKVVKA